ncbi:MAG: ribonuclease H family protein [Chitinophagaceae bacterium]|nr:ribonuclease H family protein [Chitinophagaceae bacterium]
MGKEKNNYYVVWSGAKPGIYKSWNDCQKQINGYPNAKYKGFKRFENAKNAFEKGPDEYWGKKYFESSLSIEQLKIIGSPNKKSICVDAAWNTSTLEMEYQGVMTESGEVIFNEGPFQDGTQNIGEFLAIVHALSYLKKKGSDLIIYSDSRNAISWVKDKEHRSSLVPTSNNKKIFILLERAVKWLKTNTYPNKILKWETKAWGENPADFGRK